MIDLDMLLPHPHDVIPIEKIRTDIRGLDEILKGGLPAGRTTMINGGPGTGKTILATEFLYRGARAGASGVFISFEERVEDLKANAGSLGLNLTELEQAGRLRLVHATVPHGAVRAGEFNIQGLIALIEANLQEIDSDRLVLDAIDVLMRIFGDFEREREELYILHEWLRDRRLTALLTVKTGPDRRQIYPFLDFMADCVIGLDQRMEGQVRTRRLCVAKYRGSAFLNNEYPYTISFDGMVFLPVSSMSLPAGAVMQRVSSGQSALDDVLGGGYRRGSCVLIAGPSGAGKTTLACTFTRAACARGERVLYISFEESQSSLLDGLNSAGIDLAPAVESGLLQFLTTLPEASGVEQHLLWILNVLRDFSPDHVIVDAISATQRMGSMRAAFDFLVRLLTACKEHGITCLFTNQTEQQQPVTEISGMGLSSLVDVLISLQYQDDGVRLHRRLLVIKARGSRHSMAYHNLAITDQGVNVTPVSERRTTVEIGASHA